MGYELPNEVAKIGPTMKKYGIGPGEWSILYAITAGENESKRISVERGKYAADSVEGLEAGCWASAKTLGESWNLGERTVIRHLKTLRDCGLITQKRNHADKDDLRVFRSVDRVKITALVVSLPPPKKRRRVGSIEVESVNPEDDGSEYPGIPEEVEQEEYSIL